MISLSDITNAYKNATPEERKEFNVLYSHDYVSIEEHNALKASHVDTVELLANAMKRITQLESGLFLKDSEGEIIRDDEDKPIISPKIESGIIEDAGKETFIPSGKYEKGAVELVKLAASMKPLDGKKAITCSMFHHFRNNIPVSYTH